MYNKSINIKFIRKENYQIWFNNDFEQTVNKIFQTYQPEDLIYQGEAIKISKKAISRKFENIFLKITNFPFLEGAFRHIFLRERYRNAWNISIIASNLDIAIPTPIFYLEILFYKIPWQSFFAIEYIHNSVNIEKFAQQLVEKKLTEPLKKLFSELSATISNLWANNLYHRDLSGKNILTVDGSKIYLVDLDSVKILKNFSLQHKLKNLVQIYDSFCDYVEDELLKNCIFSLLPEYNFNTKEEIYQKVKKLQIIRRSNHIKNLKK